MRVGPGYNYAFTKVSCLFPSRVLYWAETRPGGRAFVNFIVIAKNKLTQLYEATPATHGCNF